MFISELGGGDRGLDLQSRNQIFIAKVLSTHAQGTFLGKSPKTCPIIIIMLSGNWESEYSIPILCELIHYLPARRSEAGDEVKRLIPLFPLK